MEKDCCGEINVAECFRGTLRTLREIKYRQLREFSACCANKNTFRYQFKAYHAGAFPAVKKILININLCSVAECFYREIQFCRSIEPRKNRFKQRHRLFVLLKCFPASVLTIGISLAHKVNSKQTELFNFVIRDLI